MGRGRGRARRGGGRGGGGRDPSTGSEDESVTVDVPVQAKRGRGRPKKSAGGGGDPSTGSEDESETVDVPVQAKRGRGRPKKSTGGGGDPSTGSEDESETVDVPVQAKRGRGRPKTSKGGGRGGGGDLSTGSEDESETVDVSFQFYRGRGRPKTKTGAAPAPAPVKMPRKDDTLDSDPGDQSWVKGKGKAALSITVFKRLQKALPDDDRDDEMVYCSVCGEKELTYRQFRLHNIQYHLNTALTSEEMKEVIRDHKYFARKLSEFKKITKAAQFECPRENCKSSFKSTLGLAYHMNVCGRTAEELDAVLIECDKCHEKFSLPNLQWHKKIHEESERIVDQTDQLNQITTVGNRKRASAIMARRTIRKLGNNEDDEESKDDEEAEFSAESSSSSGENSASDKSPTPKKSGKSKGVPKCIDKENNDYSNVAVNFLETIDSAGRAWDDPTRNGEDLFLQTVDNRLQNVLERNEELESYLPRNKESVQFKCITDDGDDSSDYHRLTWFEGESISSNTPSHRASVFHTGGPVLSMSWHPSGKLLAVSTGKDCREHIDALKCEERRNSVQIYGFSKQNWSLQLQLIIGIRWGYATQIQWGSFFPDIMDSYKPDETLDVEVYCKIGYLAMACEDSTIRIMSVGIEDIKLKPNYEYKQDRRVPVYTKTPEICLQIHESVVDDDIGNVTKFDWHEGQQFLAAGYGNGTIAVFDLGTKSPILTTKKMEGDDTVVVINPFWVFHGHKLPVKGLCFDPGNPRYLVSAGLDRVLKVWDLETRVLRDTKRAGMCLDMCWIRGWIHQAVGCESHIAYQTGQHNYIRVFPIGSSTGKPTSATLFNFTTLDFYHGLTVNGTDDGKVNVTYYDWFWRDCDFDRNRKKKNLVALSTMQVDPDSYTKLSVSDFNVTVKKLRTSIYTSKGYQRLGVNEEEGVYSAMLEARFGGSSIFEPLETLENVGNLDEELESQQASANGDEIMDDVLDSVYQPKQKDGLMALYDVNVGEEEPKLILSFVKQRPNTNVPTSGVESNALEEFVRFQPYIRVNKVSWSPDGKVIAVGYRNGLVTLLPGAFDDIFSSGRVGGF